MTLDTVEVRTEKIDLGGGSVLHVSCFRDPATDRDRLTLVRGSATEARCRPIRSTWSTFREA